MSSLKPLTAYGRGLMPVYITFYTEFASIGETSWYGAFVNALTSRNLYNTFEQALRLQVFGNAPAMFTTATPCVVGDQSLKLHIWMS